MMDIIKSVYAIETLYKQASKTISAARGDNV